MAKVREAARGQAWMEVRLGYEGPSVGAEEFAVYSTGGEESQDTHGFKSLSYKTAFSALNLYVQSSHHLSI